MNREKVFTVLLGSHVSEKAARLGDASNHYVFKVARNATKPEIKKSVEYLFKVNVESVKTLKTKSEVRRTRYGLTNKSVFKKAYVRLAEGQDIDLTDTN
mgnify:CR=1 FL=1